MTKLFEEYRRTSAAVRAAEDGYLSLRDAKSDGCCCGLSLIGVLAYDAKIMKAHQELLEAIVVDNQVRARLGDVTRRRKDPECLKITELLALTDQERSYIKDICDMSLDEPEHLIPEDVSLFEELQKRVEYEEPLDSDDLESLQCLIEVWGSCEPMYTEDEVQNLADKVNMTKNCIK